MKQIITILLAGTAAMFMSACGGGSSSDPTTPVDPMVLKDGIAIIYHYPAEVCQSDILLNELQATVPEAENFLVRVESNDVTCATYNKVEGITDTEGCMTEDAALTDPTFLQYDTSCVIGFDINIPVAKVSKITEDTQPQWSEDIALAVGFALDAQ